jgi:hypothetical protein
MDRSPAPSKYVSYLTVVVLLALTAIGCQSVAFTAAYLFKGLDVDPDYPGLKGKTVAVVCRPSGSVQYSYPFASRELAQEINKLLKENVSKIKLIDQQKVDAFVDSKGSDMEYFEIGKGVKADMVVAVDLEAFKLKEGQTLFQGRADTVVRVYDCQKTGHGKEVFHKNLPEVVWPKGTQVPTEDRKECDFQTDYVKVLASRVGWLFYAHDPNDNLGQDADAWK